VLSRNLVNEEAIARSGLQSERIKNRSNMEVSWGQDGVGSGYGRVAGTCKYGKELSGSIKMRGIS
jgi:hypothetical protein